MYAADVGRIGMVTSKLVDRGTGLQPVPLRWCRVPLDTPVVPFAHNFGRPEYGEWGSGQTGEGATVSRPQWTNGVCPCCGPLKQPDTLHLRIDDVSTVAGQSCSCMAGDYLMTWREDELLWRADVGNPCNKDYSEYATVWCQVGAGAEGTWIFDMRGCREAVPGSYMTVKSCSPLQLQEEFVCDGWADPCLGRLLVRIGTTPPPPLPPPPPPPPPPAPPWLAAEQGGGLLTEAGDRLTTESS